jgi:transposase
MRTQGHAKELERVRMIAVKLFEAGRSSKEIAEILDVHAQTVRLWRRVWKKQGREGLLRKPHPGRPARLDGGQRGRRVELLVQGPIQNGFARHFWTTAMIAELIERTFGVACHADPVGTPLHAMGVTWQKPDRQARERGEAKIADFRQRVWPDFLKKTPRPTAWSSRPTRRAF